jgi:hypothetical protein
LAVSVGEFRDGGLDPRRHVMRLVGHAWRLLQGLGREIGEADRESSALFLKKESVSEAGVRTEPAAASGGDADEGELFGIERIDAVHLLEDLVAIFGCGAEEENRYQKD